MPRLPASPPLAGTVVVRPGDPRLRLQRGVVGERMHQVPELADRTFARSEWEERPSPVPERARTVRSGETRTYTRKVEPGPNAPQLIRLVQHPFALDTTKVRRDPDRQRPERVQVRDQVREPFGLALRHALDEGRRLPFPKPTEAHPPLPQRWRPALAEWLDSRGDR